MVYIKGGYIVYFLKFKKNTVLSFFLFPCLPFCLLRQSRPCLRKELNRNKSLPSPSSPWTFEIAFLCFWKVYGAMSEGSPKNGVRVTVAYQGIR